MTNRIDKAAFEMAEADPDDAPEWMRGVYASMWALGFNDAREIHLTVVARLEAELAEAREWADRMRQEDATFPWEES